MAVTNHHPRAAPPQPLPPPSRHTRSSPPSPATQGVLQLAAHVLLPLQNLPVTTSALSNTASFDKCDMSNTPFSCYSRVITLSPTSHFHRWQLLTPLYLREDTSGIHKSLLWPTKRSMAHSHPNSFPHVSGAEKKETNASHLSHFIDSSNDAVCLS